MGRKKAVIEYIQKDKIRRTTYDKRKKGLLKKAYELATLCDVPLCVLIYPGPNSPPVTYPEKQEDVVEVIERYLSGSREENSKRRLNLQQGLELGKRRKLAADAHQQRPSAKLGKRRKLAADAHQQRPSAKLHYTWFPANLDGFSRDELVKLVSVLDCKLQQVEERMEGLRGANLGIYNGNSNAITVGVGFEHGMHWPNCEHQFEGGGAASGVDGAGYEPDLLMGSEFYHGQVGSTSHALPQTQPLTAFYGGGVSFEPLQSTPSGHQLNWGDQGKIFF